MELVELVELVEVVKAKLMVVVESNSVKVEMVVKRC